MRGRRRKPLSTARRKSPILPERCLLACLDLSFLPDPMNCDPNASTVKEDENARTWGALQCAENSLCFTVCVPE